MRKTIVLHIDDEPVEVVLKSAKKEDGIHRAELMMEALKLDIQDLRSQVAFYQMPTCICSVFSPEYLREFTLTDFLSRIDEEDIEMWAEEAYELNPQWKKGMQALATLTEEQEKKSGTLANGSLTPTETSKKTETSRRSRIGASKTSQTVS